MRRTGRGGRAALLWTPLAMALAACGGGGDAGADGGSRFSPLRTGSPAPAYAAVDMAGDSVRLSDFDGDVVLLNLWATWCHPCREEMPALQALHEAFGDQGLHVVGVSIDGRSSADMIPGFLEEVGVTFRILRDPEERVVRSFTTMGVPETFLIGRDGTLLHRWVGAFDPMADEHRARVEAALAEDVS
jgi:cytochrome c biogenesis protein CcmG, thiol:disulfide interchange protein DsbE